jgi:hypothetical protein
MASNESDAVEIMRRLDVDYVLVIFGGLSGYQSDDINKFLWCAGHSSSNLKHAHLLQRCRPAHSAAVAIAVGGCV